MREKIALTLTTMLIVCCFFFLSAGGINRLSSSSIFAATRKPVNASAQTSSKTEASITPGVLQVMDSRGNITNLCPLKHTAVAAEISGFISRVRVTQEFTNPFTEKIEAVYTFPLPPDAAVDDMMMTVGDRMVKGRIMRREQAQAVYDEAKRGGQVASLLDQERPNVFTQSLTNILPGQNITVTISYVETLKYEDGVYEFAFPMVVGPRYIPGSTSASGQQKGGGREADTDRVPDASRITPHYAAGGTRAGQNISIEVKIDAGVPIKEIRSVHHETEVERAGETSAVVRLKKRDEIPNRDFILKIDTAGAKIEDGVLTHRAEKGGFFTLILQPPDRLMADDITPKEIVFVLDTSGSMEGFPLEKAKEAMGLALKGMNPQDTFNLITFAGDTHILFPEPVPATNENLRKAQSFLSSRSGGGGTEMMKAIKAALDPSDYQGRVRVVCFMTDGEVGNDMEIISEVQRHPQARVFAFGIGSSVNRFLLDKISEEGRGEVEYVTLQDDGSAAAKKFHERVRNPLLTDISLDWSGLSVTEVYPKRIPDLFSAKPVIVTGRYTSPGRSVIKLKGKMSGKDFSREIMVDLPDSQPRHDVIASLWARRKIDDVMGQDFGAVQQGNLADELRETITQLGLDYRLMTQFTSFVAVEEMVVTDGGEPRRIEVPVDLPEGVSREGTLGENSLNSRQISSLGLLSGKSSTNYSMASMGSVSETVTVTGSSSVSRRVQPKKTGPKRGGNTGGGGGVGGGGGGGVFASGSGAGVASSAARARPVISAGVLSADNATVVSLPENQEDQKKGQFRSKAHPLVVAVIERLSKKEVMTPGAEEAKFIRSGKADVQVWLTDKSAETIKHLEELGFEVLLNPKTSKVIIGRVPLDKLEILLQQCWVRYIAPSLNSN